MYQTLIQPAELASLLGDSELAILDCRFDLMRPGWGESEYAAAHIPGAQYAHLERDLSGPVGPHTGRHPLPDPQQLAATLGRWGIDHTVQVIAYDQGNGAFAARAWWLLRWLGARRVAVLDGGFAAWRAAGLPVTSEPASRAPRTFVPQPDTRAVLSTSEVEQALARGEIELVDARAADRFAGENETIDPVAGHVPGARNHPYAHNLGADGRFLPPGELRRRWLQTLGSAEARRVVAMCGSGVTACHNLLALEIAGLPGGRLYAGSWSEWIRDPARPVARGL